MNEWSKKRGGGGTYAIPDEHLCSLCNRHIDRHRNIILLRIELHVRSTHQVQPPVLFERVLEFVQHRRRLVGEQVHPPQPGVLRPDLVQSRNELSRRREAMFEVVSFPGDGIVEQQA